MSDDAIPEAVRDDPRDGVRDGTRDGMRDGIRDGIDHARGDWTVSGDAMRWSPGPAGGDGPGGPGHPAAVLAILGGLEESEVRARLTEQLIAGLTPLVDGVQRIGQSVLEALDAVSASVDRIVEDRRPE